MSVEKRERRKWWCCQSVVGLFFLSFFALRNFEFPAKIKKGGGKDPPDPLPPAPPLPSSTIEAAHHWCALLHSTPQPLSTATVYRCCALLPPSPPLPLSHSRHPPCHRPPLLCAVAAATATAVVQIHSTAVQRLPLLVFHQK